MEAKEVKEIRLSKKDVLDAVRDWINRRLETKIDEEMSGDLLYSPPDMSGYDKRFSISQISGIELKITKPLTQKKLRNAS